MAKVKLDTKQLKQYLFDKGERVAVYAGVGLVGLALLYCVYVLLFRASPYGEIHALVEAKKREIETKQPGADDTKVAAMPVWDLDLPANKFSSVRWYLAEEGGDNKRAKPRILPLDIALQRDKK